jgi:hypothetical protein
MTMAGFADSNGVRPDSNQNSVQASEYWSARPSRAAPVSCSGEA